MIRVTCRRVVVGLVSVLLLSGRAALSEEDEAGQALRARAREQIKSGDTNYRLSRFKEALADYEAAYRLKAHPGIIFNIAQAHRQLKDHEKACFYYKLFLTDWRRTFPDKPPPYEEEVRAHIQRLTQLIEPARAKRPEVKPPPRKPPKPSKPPTPTARLALAGLSREARVLVDGIGRPTGPAIELRPGRHRIKVALDGFRPWDRAIVLGAGAVHTERVTLGVSDHRARWLVASICASAVAAGFLAMGVAYNVRHDNFITDTPEADQNRRLSVAGYAISGGVAALAAASWTLYLLHRRKVLRLKASQRRTAETQGLKPRF